MPDTPFSGRVKYFYTAWLLALALCAALFLWAHALLSARHDAPFALPGAEKPTAKIEPAVPPALKAFDPEKDSHIVTAFSLQGMQHVTDAEPILTLLPPGNTLVVQVIKRDPQPEALLPGKDNAPAVVRYSLDYAADPAFAPASGQNSGTLGGSGDVPWFVNDSIVVLPYLARANATQGQPALFGAKAADGPGLFYAYPTARVAALDAQGTVRMETRTVLPVSTEIGCRNCHTGPWKYQDTAGFFRQTAEHILSVHDRRNRTRLTEQAAGNTAVDCRSCHSGAGEQPNLSAALHGFHAAMKLDGAEACGLCHPSAENGATRFYRDLHAMWNLDCTRCHGSMTGHALSLLRFEAERGNRAAASRMALLETASGLKAVDIQPRRPWFNLPQCSGCHDFKKKPDPDSASAFNKWTANKNERFTYAVDNTGMLRCPSCHGSPHAVYPADGPAGNNDNAQPLQYQQAAMPLGKDNNCSVCHTTNMDYFVHHDRVE
ncbi:MAG: cytochrome C [Desulfovibrionaceae bacterium]|nr:cytochrome C [Desulfovibrionaceae bacterium]